MRQVYFDPFGSQLEGFRQGVQDEVGLQDQTRRARASDWDYNNMAPLHLQAAQQAQRIANAQEPYTIRGFGLQEAQQAAQTAATQQPLYDQLALRTGDGAPGLANLQNFGLGTNGYIQSAPYFGAQAATYGQQLRTGLDPASDDYEHVLANTAQQLGLDPQAFIQHMRNMPSQVTPDMEKGQDQYLNRDFARSLANDNFTYNQGAQQNWYERQKATIEAQNASLKPEWLRIAEQNAMMRGGIGGGYGGGYGGAGGYDPDFPTAAPAQGTGTSTGTGLGAFGGGYGGGYYGGAGGSYDPNFPMAAPLPKPVGE